MAARELNYDELRVLNLLRSYKNYMLESRTYRSPEKRHIELHNRFLEIPSTLRDLFMLVDLDREAIRKSLENRSPEKRPIELHNMFLAIPSTLRNPWDLTPVKELTVEEKASLTVYFAFIENRRDHRYDIKRIAQSVLEGLILINAPEFREAAEKFAVDRPTIILDPDQRKTLIKYNTFLSVPHCCRSARDRKLQQDARMIMSEPRLQKAARRFLHEIEIMKDLYAIEEIPTNTMNKINKALRSAALVIIIPCLLMSWHLLLKSI